MSGKNLFNKVLIIDDDITGVYLTRNLLEDMNLAKQIITASNGEDGLEKMKLFNLCEYRIIDEYPDLILLDINMHIMNGYEFLEELKKVDQYHIIGNNIVVLISSSSKKDIDKMKSFGVRNYLEKPLTEDKLIPLLG